MGNDNLRMSLTACFLSEQLRGSNNRVTIQPLVTGVNCQKVKVSSSVGNLYKDIKNSTERRQYPDRNFKIN